MLAVLILLSHCVPARAQTAPSVEYQVKAAFLLNFARFVEWPTDAFASANAPITFCVFRPDPFGNALDEITQGKSIGNRNLVVRHIRDLSDAKSCQIVFVSSTESPRLAEILASLHGANVLLVGETDGFAVSGGTIEFTLEENHVRFTINTDAADRAGLTFSSKLLALAKIVHDEGHTKGG